MAILCNIIKERVTMHTTCGRSAFHPNALLQVLYVHNLRTVPLETSQTNLQTVTKPLNSSLTSSHLLTFRSRIHKLTRNVSLQYPNERPDSVHNEPWPLIVAIIMVPEIGGWNICADILIFTRVFCTKLQVESW